MKRAAILTLALMLNCAAWAWQPAPDSMLTEWGAKLAPETAWQEYPRATRARTYWSNLNGLRRSQHFRHRPARLRQNTGRASDFAMASEHAFDIGYGP